MKVFTVCGIENIAQAYTLGRSLDDCGHALDIFVFNENNIELPS